MYVGKGRLVHSVSSVEVYIPWNDTWMDLPQLPDFGGGQGRMDKTRIMSLPGLAGGGEPGLYLLGGSSSNWSRGEETDTNQVWRLMWDHGSHTYSWTDTYQQELGRLLCLLLYSTGFTQSHFAAMAFAWGSEGAGIPDNFISP